MTNQEILEKAIQKAIEGRWNVLDKFESPDWWIERVPYSNTYVPEEQLALAVGIKNEEVRALFHPKILLFNHDFAKALFANEPAIRIYGDAPVVLQPAWQYHLQQMVIADDPIKYLGENI